MVCDLDVEVIAQARSILHDAKEYVVQLQREEEMDYSALIDKIIRVYHSVLSKSYTIQEFIKDLSSIDDNEEQIQLIAINDFLFEHFK